VENHNSKIKNIVYIGRLESKKNIVNLVKAFNFLCSMFHVSCFMTLIGSPGYGYKTIKKEIDASPFRANINELGWLGREETAIHLADASILAFPSFYEGFGMPILESFASGTQVACSDIPALREVGGDIPLYFDPHNPKDIAEKLNELLTNEILRKQKVAQGLSYAKSWSWEASAKKTLDILMNL
jgi:glycosyltransferase involved in cell wall biosynthesis